MKVIFEGAPREVRRQMIEWLKAHRHEGAPTPIRVRPALTPEQQAEMALKIRNAVRREVKEPVNDPIPNFRKPVVVGDVIRYGGPGDLIDHAENRLDLGEQRPLKSEGGACPFCGKSGKDGKPIRMLHVRHCPKNPDGVPHPRLGQPRVNGRSRSLPNESENFESDEHESVDVEVTRMTHSRGSGGDEE